MIAKNHTQLPYSIFSNLNYNSHSFTHKRIKGGEFANDQKYCTNKNQSKNENKIKRVISHHEEKHEKFKGDAKNYLKSSYENL